MAKVRFKPTAAMTSMVADNQSEGKSFELLAKFKQEGDHWCLTHVEDSPMPGYSDDDDSPKPQEAKGGSVGEAYSNAMTNGGAPPEEEGY